MRATLFILFLLLVSAVPAFADEIHLNDGTVLKGKIIQVTPTAVEYDPEGNIVFDLVPRGQIAKIVYDNGNVVTLNEGGARGESKARDTRGREEEPQSGPAGYNEHDGLYFKFMYGLGSGKSTFENDDVNITLDGSQGTMRFQLGWAFDSGLILYGEYGVFSLVDPAVEVDGIEVKNTDTQYSIANLGLGLSYYFMPINIFISAGLCSSIGIIEGDALETDTIAGGGYFFAVGKEWWVSENWGLGISLYYYYGNMETDEDKFVEQYTTTDKMFGIAFSATYN